jgi:predicted transcriptional regulator YdeE
MALEIRTLPIEYTLHGHSLRHEPGRPFGPEIMSLLGRVWPVLKGQAIPNDGINRVVYEAGEEAGCTVFAGVVVNQGAEETAAAAGLEPKTIRLTHYAVWTHIGPYHLIPTTGAAMTKALEAQGHRTGWPMVEVYGHWTSDESKLETQTFVAIR